MSAVPKKKLCWNCEGNVAQQIDNCPYCGVYLQGTDLEESGIWNPSYQPTDKINEIPSPIYKISANEEEEVEEAPNTSIPSPPFHWSQMMTQLRQDIFPILFLMMGSIFFLFGIVLFLFSHEGTLTLQWQGDFAPYFLFFSLPLIASGWWFLQKLEIQ